MTTAFKPCIHFGICGGCALQDLSDDAYRARLREQVTGALARHGLADAKVDDVAQVPPGTRRRADFKIEKRDGEILIGFHEAKAHLIVDMRECLVLVPKIVAMLPGLRDALDAILRDGEKAQLHLTLAANGFDGVLSTRRQLMPREAASFARRLEALGFIRFLAGKDILLSLADPQVQFGRAEVKLPPLAFLQPTREGETLLQDKVKEIVGAAKTVADLFAGCGTFSLPLAERARVHAVEIDRGMLNALADAARTAKGLKPIVPEHRDLFKRPLEPRELERFDAIVLDPPRAGALAQAKALAQARVRRIAYVSCDAQSFARDTRVLVDGGFRLGNVTPVDQFVWSGHIELVAGFERSKKA